MKKNLLLRLVLCTYMYQIYNIVKDKHYATKLLHDNLSVTCILADSICTPLASLTLIY